MFTAFLGMPSVRLDSDEMIFAPKVRLTSRPQTSIQGPVIHRFEQLITGDFSQACQIGQGARDFEDAVVGPGAVVEVTHGVLKDAGAFGVELAELAQQLS